MAHKDIPTRPEIQDLAAARSEHSVSIYLPTGPLPADSEKARIELKNQTRVVLNQLKEDGAPKPTIENVENSINEIFEDAIFWRYQAQSLAIFINADGYQTFRLPNKFTATVDVADRFYIKPLMRTITFKQSAYVLALAQNSVRLIKVTADQPAEVVDVPGMPKDFDSYFISEMPGRQRSARGSHDESVRVQQFAAAVNKALFPVVRSTKLPLILASAEPMASAYRRSNSYKYIASEGIAGNPESLTDENLAERTRPILDTLYKEEIAEVVENFKAKQGQLMGSSELHTVAEGAVLHAIDTLLIDFDQRVPGYIEEDGTVTLSDGDDASNYGVADEIVRLALMVNARVYAVRSDEMPDGAAVAATFRFPVS